MNVKTKSLIANILPALGGLFVTYLYNVVDGIFVGQGVGSAALGAVKALMIFCLPLIFGAGAIWIAPFVTEVLTLAAAIVLSRMSKLIYR